MPVGFKWFVDGLLDGSLGFGGEESAGASFLRRDGTVWTTDKDGIVPALLAAEITARTGRDPGELYRELTRELGEPCYRPRRCAGDARAEEAARRAVGAADPVHRARGRKDQAILTRAPGNDAPIGGVKVIAETRLVCGAPVGHRRHLQDLCREFPRSGASAAVSSTRHNRSSMRF